jgi:hypothetical protein
MCTDEGREEANADIPALHVTAERQPTPPTATTEFEPHSIVDLEGVLICAQARPRSPQALATLCLPALTEQVAQAGVWNFGSADAETRLGDYRFLVLDFTDAADICRFVQIWSEPHCDLTMEVGPGNREDATLQAVADGMRPALIGRGFEIGGNANNFCKLLVAPSPDGARCIASEMFAILAEVHGYDGTIDLKYRLDQNTRLEASHVLYGINGSQLFDWLNIWGLNPRRVDDQEDFLTARERELPFTIMLRVSKQGPWRDFWEIYCYTTFPLPSDAAAELLELYNARPSLFRVFAGNRVDESTRQIGVVIGINLAGGVTPTHIRCQIREWLDAVRRLRHYRASPPGPVQSAAKGHRLN